MKIDIKTGIIILLVGIVGMLVGVLLGKSSQSGGSQSIAQAPVQAPSFAPADDGKLAKEYKEKVLIKTLFDNAKDLQKCYFELLDKKPKISEGVMDMLIKVEEDGSISQVRITKNEFQDNDMGECVADKVKTYFLAPPPFGINRYISHSLAFKSEETAKKEAEERAEKNKPPKIMPVNP